MSRFNTTLVSELIADPGIIEAQIRQSAEEQKLLRRLLRLAAEARRVRSSIPPIANNETAPVIAEITAR